MENGQCSLCNEKGHTASSCPELVNPLKEGFQGGGSGGRSHSHDEDEHIKKNLDCPVFYTYISMNLSWCNRHS